MACWEWNFSSWWFNNTQNTQKQCTTYWAHWQRCQAECTLVVSKINSAIQSRISLHSEQNLKELEVRKVLIRIFWNSSCWIVDSRIDSFGSGLDRIIKISQILVSDRISVLWMCCGSDRIYKIIQMSVMDWTGFRVWWITVGWIMKNSYPTHL